MADKSPVRIDRRGFFGKLFAVSTAASALTLARPGDVRAKVSRSPKTGGYRESDHIRRYYRSARG